VTYAEEFRREAIRLAQLGGKPQRKLAKDLGISDVTLRHWLKEEKAARGERPGGLSSDEREELKRLQDENATLREDPADPRAGRGVYGAPRIHAELCIEHEVRVGRKRVARLMKTAGISASRLESGGARRSGSPGSRPRPTSSSASSGLTHQTCCGSRI
jgi:transposase